MEWMDDFGPEPPEEDFDQLMEDEAELEVLREMEADLREKSPPQPRFHAKSNPSTKKAVDEENIDDLIEEYLENDPELKSPEPKRFRTDASARSPLKEIASNVPSTYQIPQIGERKIYRRRPEGSDYQGLTMNDGSKLYLRFKEDEDEDEVAEEETGDKFKRMGLCGVPYRALYNQALVEQSKFEVEKEETEGDVAIVEKEDVNNNSSTLWVDKFRPKHFLELLSDDGTNRTLLKWLKLWDKVVFNKEKKAVKQKPGKEETNTNFKPGPTELNEELDSLGRPRQKIALLHGPPGLGKTTLAHVIAATAGYNVVEMNASDDRTLAKFKEKLEASTQMKSVMNRDRKPNCLIIDEIDGSPSQTINYLVSLISKVSGVTNAKKTKKKDDIVIQRPIICICNDLYVPALRPLRQHALLVPFPPTLSTRLAQRLAEITSKESMKADQTALLALAEKSSNDIRACLSTLQFFKGKGQALKAVDVHKSFVGQKDAQKSHFAVWKELFHSIRLNLWRTGLQSCLEIPRSSSKRKFVAAEGNVMEENMSSMPARYKNILRTVQACGDYDRVMQGVFENYLDIKFKDQALQNVVSGHGWFTFFDTVQQHINHSQNYSTMGFIPYVFVASHLLFGASGLAPKIKYPTTQYEKNNAAQRSTHIIDSVISEMAPSERIFSTPKLLLTDILPLLLEIIKPNLRPVNTQLYSAREKEDLKSLVLILLSYNLTYVQERALDGQYIYKLDPGVEDVVYFPEINHKSLPYAIKQMIAHEVEVEKMRRDEPQAANPVPVNKKVEEKKILPNHLNQTLKAKAVEDIEDKAPTDFFGRKIVQKPGSSGDSSEQRKKEKGLLSSDIWFKFKEGYNNAVRRNVRLKDLA